MIAGIGVDIVSLSRFAAVLARHPRRLPRRILTESERAEREEMAKNLPRAPSDDAMGQTAGAAAKPSADRLARAPSDGGTAAAKPSADRLAHAPSDGGTAAAKPSATAVYLAGRWAAKEALAKALGCGIRAPITWQNIAVTRDQHRRPTYAFTAAARQYLQARGIAACHLSLSHDGDSVIATAITETTPG